MENNEYIYSELIKNKSDSKAEGIFNKTELNWKKYKNE